MPVLPSTPVQPSPLPETSLPPPSAPSQGRPDADGGRPRLAEGQERPVESPVHALHRELERLDRLQEAADQACGSRSPGWLRLALPLALSVVLWGAILRAVSLLG